MGFLSVFLKGKLFRFIFFRGIQKTEGLTAFPGMFAMVNIMGIDHPLKIMSSFFRAPLQSLMYKDVVKYKIE